MSANYYTPKECCSVHYKDLDYAVQTFLELFWEIITEELKHEDASNQEQIKWRWHSHYIHHHRKSNKSIYSSKTDIKSAF